jgi:multidrug efflux pump subunit AcrA (membrane-fusion protein)/YHS domain-containing protein
MSWAMKSITYALLVVLLAIGCFAGGIWWNQRSLATASHQQKVLYYACPMHPQYRSDKAGDCPSCGMRLETVYAQGAGGPAPAGEGALPGAGAIQVTSERQQAIGVRLGVAERVSGTRVLRTTGRVAANENATYPLEAGVDARVREVRNPTAGTQVRKDELLASLYAPELLTVSQGYIVALSALERLPTDEPNQMAGARANLQRAEETLRNLGVPEVQIEELRTKRRISPSISIASPVDGFILQRNILVGQRVARGTELYRIADLSRVWILADVYENQLRFIRSGMKARVTAAQQNRQLEAAVSSAQPIFDEATRTMRVRLEVDNPGFALKPGMFVDVEFGVELPPALAVPADAIVDSGLRRTLFVDRGNGFFELRQIEIGWRIGDLVEVTGGLMPGERIVISGTFLLDSESRMKAAATGVSVVTVRDPICGMGVDPAGARAAGRTSTYQGVAYYFCAADCKKAFDANPAKYASR